MEIWDGYFADGTKAGVDLIRGQKQPEGLYHLVCDILVRHADGDYLLMQRDFRKPIYPGRLEATAGGSALKGEDAPTCARRELFEETGIDRGTFTEIGRSRNSECLYVNYLCETDFPKDGIVLQEGETIAHQWMSKEKFKEFVNSEEMLEHLRERLRPYLTKEGIL